MTQRPELRFLEDAALEPPPAKEARPSPREANVFVRNLTAPAGWPWEQRRAIELEARHGSPLPLSEVVFRVQRLGTWRPGASGRFAAFYVLARDIDGHLDATAEVDGRTVTVSFTGGGASARRAGRVAGMALPIAVAVVAAASATTAALNRRTETVAALALAEQHADNRLRRLEVRRRIADEGRLLEQELGRGARLREAVSDLAWLSGAKRPASRIESVHWDRGLLTLEARGEEPPFDLATDRVAQRSRGATRPGVWLWAVVRPDGTERLEGRRRAR